MTSIAYFFGGPKDGVVAARQDAPFELKFSIQPEFKIEDLPLEALCREVRVDEALYRRRGPVREGVAYYDFVAEAPV